LIVALPGLPALNFVDDPKVGESLPLEADHEGDTAIMLPNPSAPEAKNTREAPDMSVAVVGFTASFARAPGFTVTTSSAPARPGALAAIVAVPALVSR
jgi:hypothetical protein